MTTEFTDTNTASGTAQSVIPEIIVQPDIETDVITNDAHKTAFEWLSPMADFEVDERSRLSCPKIVDSLIKDAQKHGRYSTLLKLQSVKNFLELCDKYRRNPKVKNPRERASLAVAKGVGKGPYFAKSLRRLSIYIERYGTLPPTGSGRHHAHPSLLNDERILQAVRRYLNVIKLGEVHFH